MTWTDDEMIGTGPFKLKSFTPQAVTLEPNADYWGDDPEGRQLRYDAFNDNAGLTTALTTGEAQWGWTFIPDYENTSTSPRTRSTTTRSRAAASASTCST